MPRRDRSHPGSSMTYTEEKVAAETGRVLLALYRAGMEVHLSPDAINNRASARIVPGPSAKRRATAPRSASGTGDSPLAAICAAVERLNERAGAIVVELD
ncbi:MAG: hypothetical protein IPO09_03160 [Anaeromyxobacter sp.]|nr:hypothetical protein [Anaeromyxobacter sp.]MBL0275581.1 hypothetical protein [Anaeromyxobacter sp.]